MFVSLPDWELERAENGSGVILLPDGGDRRRSGPEARDVSDAGKAPDGGFHLERFSFNEGSRNEPR